MPLKMDIFDRKMFLRPISVEFSQAGAVLDRSAIGLARTPVREGCDLSEVLEI